MKRLLAVLSLLSVAAAASLATPAAVRADMQETSGTLTMSSDAGDYIGQGQSYSFASPGTTFSTYGNSLSFDGNVIRVSAQSANEWWNLDFQAPAGQIL